MDMYITTEVIGIFISSRYYETPCVNIERTACVGAAKYINSYCV